MKTIAIMIGNNQSEYIKSLMNEFDSQSKELGIRLIFLSGYRIPLEFGVQDEEDYGNDKLNYYQFSSIYDYVSSTGADGCIICYGPMTGIMGTPSYEEVLKLCKEMPFVMLEIKPEDESIPFVATDSYSPMKDMVRHLTDDHGYKKIAFLAGPKDNYSSNLRLQAYKDVMAEAELEVNDDMIAFGDYTTRVKPLVRDLLDKNPRLEAICCANDSMARACYNVCAERGIKVGEDIAVTGFDNSDISSKLKPALTTVSHDSDLIVKRALSMALKVIDGEEVKGEEHPLELIKRCSCGCKTKKGIDTKLLCYHPGIFANENIDNYDINMAELKAVVNDMAMKNDSLVNRFWDVSFFVREFIAMDISSDNYFDKLFLRLREIGLNNAYFFVHKTPLVYETDNNKENRKHMYFAGGFNEDENTIIPINEWHHYQIGTHKGFNAFLPDDEEIGNYHTYVLFSGESQYGVMLSKSDVSDNEYLLHISLQISNLLHIFNLKTREEAVVKEMERSIERVKESNQILSFISRYDELTKILNRRGFMEQALATIQRIPGREALIMFGDLDHLKEINDCFGHADGDFAILSAAQLLTGLMPRDGFVARIGGDEFVAFVPVPGDTTSEEYISKLKKKLKEAMFVFNLTCNKPYFVEISSGFYPFVCERNMDLTKIIASSDEVLYDDKQKRRKSIKKDKADAESDS